MSTSFDQFEFFEGAGTHNRLKITVRRSGQVSLTGAAVALLGEGVTAVQLGYDTVTKAVGIRPAPEGSRGRYKLRQQANPSGLWRTACSLPTTAAYADRGPDLRRRGLRPGDRGFPVHRAGSALRLRASPRRSSSASRPAVASASGRPEPDLGEAWTVCPGLPRPSTTLSEQSPFPMHDPTSPWSLPAVWKPAMGPGASASGRPAKTLDQRRSSLGTRPPPAGPQGP